MEFDLEGAIESEGAFAVIERKSGRIIGKSLMIGHARRFVERVVFVVGENNLRSRGVRLPPFSRCLH